MRIKEIPRENRPRERLRKVGMSALSTAEILAIIFQKGTKNRNVLEMANNLLSTYSLASIKDLTLRELITIKGIGPAKGMQLLASLELAKRIEQEKTKNYSLNTPGKVYEYARPRMKDLKQEEFRILLLNTKKNLIKEKTITIGTINATIIHPREIFNSAIKEHAHSVILLHNHPSGDSNPSQEDKHVTQLMLQASRIVGIRLIDHLIITKKNYYSFKEKGDLDSSKFVQ